MKFRDAVPRLKTVSPLPTTRGTAPDFLIRFGGTKVEDTAETVAPVSKKATSRFPHTNASKE